MRSDKLKIFQFYGDEQARRWVFEGAVGVNTAGRIDRMLENRLIANIVNEGEVDDAQWCGFWSWKFVRKSKLGWNRMLQLFEANLGSDVISFYGCVDDHLWRSPLMNRSLIEAANLIFAKLGYDVDVAALDPPYILHNHWIARSGIVQKYVAQVLNPAMALMEADDRIRALCMRDANYGHVGRPGYATKEQALKIFGVPYYTLHPFVLERMFPTWLALTGYAVKNLYKEGFYRDIDFYRLKAKHLNERQAEVLMRIDNGEAYDKGQMIEIFYKG